MSESTFNSKIIDYPKHYGLQYETHQDTRKFFLQPYDRYLKTNYIIFKKGDLIFYAQDSFGVKAYTTSMFTGIYKPIVFLENSDLTISKKDFLDIFSSDKIKIENEYVHKKLTLKSKNKNYMGLNLNNDFANQFIELNDLVPPMKLIVQNGYLQNIESFKGKTIIGIETNRWIYKFEDVERMFKYGEILIKDILKKVLNIY